MPINMILFLIVYLFATLAYTLIFYKYDFFSKYGSGMFFMAFLSWPLIFVASLFSLPFFAFMKLIREDKNNDT